MVAHAHVYWSKPYSRTSYEFFFPFKFHLYNIQHRIPVSADLCFSQKILLFVWSLPVIPVVYQKGAPKAFSIKSRKSAGIWITFQQYFRNLLPLYSILSRNIKSVAIQWNITCKIYTAAFKEKQHFDIFTYPQKLM